MRLLVFWVVVAAVLSLAFMQHVLAAILLGALAVGFSSVLPYFTGTVSRRVDPLRPVKRPRRDSRTWIEHP